MSKNAESDIFVLDRPCDLTTAVLWYAAISKDVKFDTVSTFTSVEKLENSFMFSDRINKCIDLLYGIRFSLPVRNFRLFVRYPSGVGRALINLTEYDTGVKRIVFDPPIPICRYPYIDFNIEYTFKLGDDIDACFQNTIIFTQYSLLNPVFENMLLSTEKREKVKAEPSRFEFSPRIFNDEEIGVLPSVILSP